MLRVTVRSLGVAGEVHESAEGASWEWSRARVCRAARGRGESAPDHESAEGGTGVASAREWRLASASVCYSVEPRGQNAELSHVVCSETVRAHMSVCDCDCEFAGRIAVRALFGQRDAPVEEY